MPLTLSDLPIERTNRKKVSLVVYALMFSASTAVVIWIIILLRGRINLLFSTRNWPYTLFWPAGSGYALIATYLRHSKLLIDREGVHVTTNGYTRHYRWSDIARTRKIVVNPRSGAEVTQIIRKGQIIMDNKSDLIWGEFGLSPDELQSLIKAGCDAWGSQALA